MPKGTALTEGSSGENISHFALIRVRLNGVGLLRITIYSLDDVRSKTLIPLFMQTTSRIIPSRLVNFTEQRAAIELKTTSIGEYMRINRIIVFMKEVFTSYPGS